MISGLRIGGAEQIPLRDRKDKVLGSCGGKLFNKIGLPIFARWMWEGGEWCELVGMKRRGCAGVDCLRRTAALAPRGSSVSP